MLVKCVKQRSSRFHSFQRELCVASIRHSTAPFERFAGGLIYVAFREMDRKDSVADINATVKLEAIKHMIKLQFKDQKTRIGDDTVRLVGEVVQLLIVEAAARSCNQALLSRSTVVEMEHVERVLVKLLLDF